MPRPRAAGRRARRPSAVPARAAPSAGCRGSGAIAATLAERGTKSLVLPDGFPIDLLPEQGFTPALSGEPGDR
ncbi:hypothetical protein OG315_36380 [Streptomyces atratus]|nr:hypothetical protein [Streptomyces atratus]